MISMTETLAPKVILLKCAVERVAVSVFPLTHSHKVWLMATLVLTLLSLSVWIVGAVVIGCDIASRMISGKKVDYGDGDKHGAE